MRGEPFTARAIITRDHSPRHRNQAARAASRPDGSGSTAITTLRTSAGSTRLPPRFPADNAAQHGKPSINPALAEVSIPSPIAISAANGSIRTAPPQTGPRLAFCGSASALPLPSGFRNDDESQLHARIHSPRQR